MKLTKPQSKLLEFVKEQHGSQLRKYTNEPYWTHVYSVAERVSNYFDGIDSGVIEAALCHDLFEDTPCTPTLLQSKLKDFGYSKSLAEKIVTYTSELTDHFTHETYPALNRAKRKELERIRLSNISTQAQSIKYADLIDNCESIVAYDPGFAVTYLKEKKLTLEVMNQGNFDLYMEACYTYITAEKLLQL